MCEAIETLASVRNQPRSDDLERQLSNIENISEIQPMVNLSEGFAPYVHDADEHHVRR